MAIQIEEIAVNRYAPRGSEGINLYSTGLDGGSGLTIAQLAIAVSMRSAANYEAQSVIKMNGMASDSQLLSKASEYLQAISDGSGDWPTIKAFLRDSLGIDTGLPDDLSTYDRRMTAVAAAKAKVDALAQSQQEDMINLQTLVNRRDVAFSASSNIVRTLGTSQSGNAENLH